jgi:hypothetical protein
MGRKVAAVVAVVCLGVAFALAGSASADVAVGVNDDAGKFESEVSWFYPTMAETGLAVNAITVRWDDFAVAPLTEHDQARIEQAIERAEANGVTIALDIYPLRSQVFTNGRKCAPSSDPEACGSTARIKQFAAWAATIARTFPTVREFVVMNECNQPLFVNPQWNTAGKNQSAAICGRALAAAYDALKAESGGIHVWGIGLSPRGNDRPDAVSNSSTKPVTFLAALGEWFRAFAKKTGRTAPLMDGLDFHPYPIPQSQPFATGYLDERSASVSNLPRIYQAFYGAFAGTPQRTIGQQRGGGLPVSLNETGVQTASDGKLGYAGFEVSASSAGGILGRFGTEDYQSSWYVQMLDLVACDPNVSVVNIFHLIDEENLAGWQSGLYFADKTPKRSARTVRDWIARTGGLCQRTEQAWRPGPPAALPQATLKPPKAKPATAKAKASAKVKAAKAKVRVRVARTRAEIAAAKANAAAARIRVGSKGL